MNARVEINRGIFKETSKGSTVLDLALTVMNRAILTEETILHSYSKAQEEDIYLHQSRKINVQGSYFSQP